jgi:hypothetical protein
MQLMIAGDSAVLTARMRSADSAQVLRYYGGDTFGLGDNRFTFVRRDGAVTGLNLDLVYGFNRLVRR